MSILRVDGRGVASVIIADDSIKRLVGLAFRRHPKPMWFPNTNSVHGLGLLVTLDVAFIDRNMTVVKMGQLRPFGASWKRRSSHTLEAPLGSFESWGLQVGSHVEPDN